MTTETASRRTSALRVAIDVAASLTMLAAAGAVLWVAVRQPPVPAPARGPIHLPKEPLSIEDAPVLGHPDAPVVMIQFSDFECPFCRQFVKETLPEIEAKYIEPGKMQLVFRHLPITAKHPRAQRAAEAAECAARQDKFWAMHDALFADPQSLEESMLEDTARGAGLNLSAFRQCMAGQAVEVVTKDSRLADALGVRGTPTFLVGKLLKKREVQVVAVVKGALPASEFSNAIEASLRDIEGPLVLSAMPGSEKRKQAQ